MKTKLKLLAAVLFFALAAIASLVGPVQAKDTDSRLGDLGKLQASTGTAYVRTASAAYTSYQNLLAIAPDSQNAIFDVRVVVDLDLASTGFVAGYAAQTIQFSVARKVDGTNFRTSNNLASSSLAASSAGSQSIELVIGSVGPNEQLQVMVKLSSTVGQPDIALPYALYYRSLVRPKITPVP